MVRTSVFENIVCLCSQLRVSEPLTLIFECARTVRLVPQPRKAFLFIIILEAVWANRSRPAAAAHHPEPQGAPMRRVVRGPACGWARPAHRTSIQSGKRLALLRHWQRGARACAPRLRGHWAGVRVARAPIVSPERARGRGARACRAVRAAGLSRSERGFELWIF